MYGRRLSRVFVVKSTIEETHDNLQHWGAKAYFVACFSTKDAETLDLCGHGFLMLALHLELLLGWGEVLPLGVLLMPVVCRRRNAGS
jgi:hypothetical protein